MIQTIFAWLLVVGVVVAAYPWAVALTPASRSSLRSDYGRPKDADPLPPSPGRRRVKRERLDTDGDLVTEETVSDRRWLTWCVALALGIGVLTLLMFWESLLGLPLTVGGVTLLYALLALIGWMLRRRLPRPISVAETLASTWPERLATLALIGIAAAILFNAAYWPFSREDAIGIYDAQAKQITATGAILPLTGPDSLYLAYPALMPLAYAYTYMASGWHNEYLARVLAALLALGCLPATFLLGRSMGGRRVGWLSVLIFALAPTFGKWASQGYVDLPMAFYYALAGLFAWRLSRSNEWRDALLAGVMLGLAAWTKNAALIGVPLLAAWLIILLLSRRIGWRPVVIALTACALVAGPWYIRNLLGAGFLIPATAWTDRAGHTVANLLVFVLKPENFALSGWLIMLGVVAGVVTLIRRRDLRSAESFLLWWTVPFFAAWWLFVSYDPRFLLLFLPPLCVLAGLAIARLWSRVPSSWSARLTWQVMAVVLLAALAIMFIGVEFKHDLIHAPFMSDADKHEVVERK